MAREPVRGGQKIHTVMFNLDIPTLISRVFILLISLTIHEFAHASLADSFGDHTPRRAGRVSLNPIVHIDPIGTLLILIKGFGWAKPVPVDHGYLYRRSSAAPMLVSLVGPLSNLALALVGAIVLRLDVLPVMASGRFLPTPIQFAQEFLYTNVLLSLFNLLPIPPLDGSEVLRYFIPFRWQNAYSRYIYNGPLVLIILMLLLPYLGIDPIGWILWPAADAISKLLLGVGA